MYHGASTWEHQGEIAEQHRTVKSGRDAISRALEEHQTNARRHRGGRTLAKKGDARLLLALVFHLWPAAHLQVDFLERPILHQQGLLVANTRISQVNHVR